MCMYDSILNHFVQRSQYRGIKFPLNKKSVVNKCMLIKELRDFLHPTIIFFNDLRAQ